jgi:HAD superfamily hydrolase (TIGR01549 family)
MLDDALKAMIDDADVVSFDVFDTLVFRRHYSPADLFPRHLLRIAAEHAARRLHRKREDITLAQIYALLRGSPDEEIAAERQTLYANPKARAIYNYARAQGKRVIAVSDMYLPGAIVRELLAATGYEHFDNVYLSCDAGVTKGVRGTLFRHVIDDLGVPPQKIVHIGDHPISDVKHAELHGLRAVHLPSPRMRFQSGNAVHPGIVRALRRRRKPAHSLLLGILRDGLADWDGDYWYAFGLAVVGPIVNAFCDWIAAQYAAGGHDRAFFFARDGHLPIEVMRVRHPHVASQYTYASRRLFLVPSLETLSEKALTSLSTALPGTPADEYWSRLGIDNGAVEELLARRFEPGERIALLSGRQRVEAFFREAHPLFLPDVAREKAALRGYLTSIGLLGGSARPLIVDVGWNASSQRHLENAFPELRGTAGAYFGLRREAYRNGAMRAFLFDGTRSVALQTVEIVELMFSAPHASVRRLNDDFTPVYEPLSPQEEERIARVRRIHAGALDFTQRLRELEAAGYRIPIGRDDVEMILRAVILDPTPQDVEHLGALPHALGLGTSQYETLLPQPLTGNPFTIVRYHLGKPRKYLYWPRGMIRAVQLRDGRLRGLAARAAVEFSSLIVQGWTRVLRMMGR